MDTESVPNENDTNKNDEIMSLLTTTTPPLDWEIYLTFEHVMILNEIPPTYNKQLCQKMNTLVKVTNDADKVKNYSLELIEREYHVRVLGEVICSTPITPIISESSSTSKPKTPATSESGIPQIQIPSQVQTPSQI